MDSNTEGDSIMDDFNNLQQLPEITITTTRTNKDEEPQHFNYIQKKLNTFHNYKITLYNTNNLIETNHIQQMKLSLFKNNQIVGCYISHQNNSFNNSNGSNNNYDSLCINHKGTVKNECFNQINEVTIKPIPRPLTFNEKSILLSIVKENEKEKWKIRTERFNQLTGNDVDSMYLRSCYGNLQRQLKKSNGDNLNNNLQVYNSCKKEDFKICEKYLTIKFRMVDNSCYKIPQNNQFKLRITIIVKDNNDIEKELNFDSNLFCIISKERSIK
ncbi:hypothetical protein ABK040_014578 [Willaertia magna]